MFSEIKKIMMTKKGIIGIGGIFIKFKNPTAIKKWYQETLGILTNDYGILFETKGIAEEKGVLQLGTFEENSTYFGKEEQQCMINFKVNELEEYIEQLRNKKVKFVDEMETYSYGKFIHIEDPEGNRIELWEPVADAFEDENKS